MKHSIASSALLWSSKARPKLDQTSGLPTRSANSAARSMLAKWVAMESAKQANSPCAWKEVTFACVENKEFKLAVIAGLNIITHIDHLENIIRHYEHWGYSDELIILIGNGLLNKRARPGIFTEIGALYVKYRDSNNFYSNT